MHKARVFCCVAAAACLLAVAGCGGSGAGSGFEPYCLRTDSRFYSGCETGLNVAWTSVNTTECRGEFQSTSIAVAKNVRLELWYATAQGEVQRVVVPPGGVAMAWPPLVSFVAPPQLTNGEPRFPRLGQLTWAPGASWPGHVRTPSVAPDSVWCRVGTDSVRGQVRGSASWAYHVVVRVETRDGVLDIPTIPDRFGPGEHAYYHCPPRDSAGVLLNPKILRIQWEDYGGIAKGVDSPNAASGIQDCN